MPKTLTEIEAFMRKHWNHAYRGFYDEILRENQLEYHDEVQATFDQKVADRAFRALRKALFKLMNPYACFSAHVVEAWHQQHFSALQTYSDDGEHPWLTTFNDPKVFNDEQRIILVTKFGGKYLKPPPWC